jgi:hypothetical protein
MRSRNSKDQFERTVDFLLEDIESMSPSEVEAELHELGINPIFAESMVREAAQACRQKVGAVKLALAKQHLRENSSESATVTPIDGARAKAALQLYWKQNPSERPTTLAARKGEGISDDTALKIYQSLIDLGAISPGEGMEDV